MNAGNHRGKAGFTISELVMATFVMMAMMALAVGVFTSTMRSGREGSFHLQTIDESRSVEQTIARLIRRGRAVSVSGNSVRIVMADGGEEQIRFIDQDSDPETLDDNILQYDPTVGAGGDEVTLCRQVTALTSEAMFQTVATSPKSALLSFHLGEVPKPGDALMVGEGYQGVEIRLAATPRNLCTVYTH